jgi:uncharacterized protein with NAD-binding domain and iron-sulfur cluster
VFRDGFLSHPKGFEVEIPTVPLGELYGPRVLSWLEGHGVQVQLLQGVRRLDVSQDRVAAVEMRDGTRLAADAVLSTVPFDRLLDLLPGETVEQHCYFRNLRHLETSPITSVHLWWDRPILPWPHVVLVDCLGQWVFRRGTGLVPLAADEADALERNKFRSTEYVQVVVSAARQLKGLGNEEVQRRIVAELKALFPTARQAQLLRGRVITEHGATFSAVAGVDRWRPPQTSPLAGLFIAGDWTATGWPATMEGAVRSGYLAAEAMLAAWGTPRKFLRPDLGGG